MNFIKLAKEAGFSEHEAFAGYECTTSELLHFATLVAAHEREACAKVCEDRGPKEGSMKLISDGFAALIRARGEK